MIKFEFKHSDFSGEGFGTLTTTHAKNVANKRLAEMLKDAVMVYGSLVKHKDEYEWAQEFKQGDTHKALLVNITEIEKKSCKHKPMTLDDKNCKYCGIELIAEWKEKT